MTHRRTQYCAFTLTEVLASLIMLTIFFALAGKVFRSAILLGAAGENLSNTTSRIDSALYQLRSDVWNSNSISVTNPQSVDLTLADGNTITWKITPDQKLTRTAQAAPTETWQATAKNWSFSTDNVSLTISNQSPTPTRLTSQILLAQWMRP